MIGDKTTARIYKKDKNLLEIKKKEMGLSSIAEVISILVTKHLEKIKKV